MVKDRIASSSRLSNFLIEQGAETLAEVEKKGTAFFDAKDIFSSGLTAVLNIGAAATF